MLHSAFVLKYCMLPHNNLNKDRQIKFIFIYTIRLRFNQLIKFKTLGIKFKKEIITLRYNKNIRLPTEKLS